MANTDKNFRVNFRDGKVIDMTGADMGQIVRKCMREYGKPGSNTGGIETITELKEKPVAKITLQAGRLICVDEKPFVNISRPTGTMFGPTEADAFAHFVANNLDWDKFQEFLKEYKKS